MKNILKPLYLLSISISNVPMKYLLSLISTILISFSAFCNDTLTVFYRIRLDQDINSASRYQVTAGLEKAAEAEADYVILDLNTYGGEVSAADSIRSAILRYDRPVIAYVNMQAASAGALISIACDSIYMKTGSSIGAATVVNQTGEVMPDKYQSFMRGMMRSTAQATGRDPKIAESMTDTANVLSMTPSEVRRKRDWATPLFNYNHYLRRREMPDRVGHDEMGRRSGHDNSNLSARGSPFLGPSIIKSTFLLPDASSRTTDE